MTGVLTCALPIYTHLKNRFRRFIGGFFVRTHVRAGKNNAGRLEFTNEFVRNLTGMDFTVNVSLTDPARDKLRHLASKVKNKYAIVIHVGLKPLLKSRFSLNPLNRLLLALHVMKEINVPICSSELPS